MNKYLSLFIALFMLIAVGQPAFADAAVSEGVSVTITDEDGVTVTKSESAQSVGEGSSKHIQAEEAYQPKFEREANALHELGLFFGTDKGFELDKTLTRLEGAAMVARLLGEEEAIQNGDYDHLEMPFTDVPAWGQGYVKYLYNNKITAGTGKTTFGSNDQMTAEQYVTFMLRILGYDDIKGDFEWRNSLSFSSRIGLYDSTVADEIYYLPPGSNRYAVKEFLRDHMVKFTYNTLYQTMKDSPEALIEHLATKGVLHFEKESGDNEIPLINRKIDSGVKISWSGPSNIITEINRDELPDHMKDYVYFYVVSVGIDSTMTEIDLEMWEDDFKRERAGRQGNKLYSGGITELQMICVFLLNLDRDIIGYYTLNATDIKHGSKEIPIN